MHVRKCNVEVRQAEKSEPGELANLFGEVGEAGCHRMLRLIIQTPTDCCLKSEIGEIDIRLVFIQFNVYIYNVYKLPNLILIWFDGLILSWDSRIGRPLSKIIHLLRNQALPLLSNKLPGHTGSKGMSPQAIGFISRAERLLYAG